jgi:hypothetical protein
MTKAIVQIGYTNYVLDANKAVELAALLAECEVFEEKWRKTEEGGPTFHVYPQEHTNLVTLKLMSKPLYNMAKLAGKPQA